MAKTFLVIVCVCYCTICMHIAYAAKLSNENNQVNELELDSDVLQLYGHTRNINERKSDRNSIKYRNKRHAEIGHNDNSNKLDSNSREFIKKLFERFGNSDDETMNVAGFEKMMEHLGIRLMPQLDASNNNGKDNVSTMQEVSNTNNSCVSSVSLMSKFSSNTLDSKSKKTIENYDNLVENMRINKGNTSTNDSINSIRNILNLNKNDLWSMCPLILYQLTAPTERAGCVDKNLLLSIEIDDLDDDCFECSENNRTLVWVYASLSITIASLCGLLGVAVIPCMERKYYNFVLQYFVALAVGTLAGDALLHLLPHAMLTLASDDDGHTSMTWKGLIAALGIIFFFLTEKILTMIAEWRKRIQKRDDPPARVRVMRDMDSISINSLNGEKQCKHKYSSYPYCYDEITLTTKDDHHQHHQHGKENGLKQSSPLTKEKLCAKSLNDKANDNDTAQSLLSNPNCNNIGAADAYYKPGGDKEDIQTPDNNTVLTNLDDGSIDACGCDNKKTTENYTIILREHESTHHGHSHTHGHVHSPPKTLSAVAWMVVMGDGLHNFTDGMAIGAAFSNSIAGGFSTAIAVFCHELPHELGDFAVLIKAGMSARKAVYYNVLSSVLSFFGMIVGIIVGDTPEASAWIFACAAGMFIYIALVDMMPELTTAHNEHSAFTQCFLQLAGMLTGVAIMLLIALYEHDLKIIFTSDNLKMHNHSHDHHHHH